MNGRLTPKRTRRISKPSKQAETKIVLTKEPLEPAGPYCALPSSFFEHALRMAELKNTRKTLLSITTWNGRSVMQVERGER